MRCGIKVGCPIASKIYADRNIIFKLLKSYKFQILIPRHLKSIMTNFVGITDNIWQFWIVSFLNNFCNLFRTFMKFTWDLGPVKQYRHFFPKNEFEIALRTWFDCWVIKSAATIKVFNMRLLNYLRVDYRFTIVGSSNSECGRWNGNASKILKIKLCVYSGI